MTALLLDPFGGLAGDMLLAALLDLERPELGLADLRGLAEELLPGEARLEVAEVSRGGLRGLRLDVHTPESHHAPHRHLADLLGRLEEVTLPAQVRARAARCLTRLAEAESRVHGIPVEDVHFHEVGAVDTLIDVVGAFVALERLGVERVACAAPYVGAGTVACAHGTMPVPAPGTAELLRGRAFRAGPGGERLTPTGAALLAELAEAYAAPPASLRVLANGYGAGGRDPDEGPPNLVRAQLCAAEPEARPGADEVLVLEFNLDDATGEEVGFLLEELRGAGALEVWTSPVQMKKGRPGVVVTSLVAPARRPALERVAFDHSPTLGVRWSLWKRTTCARAELRVEVRGHPVRVKVRERPGGPAGALDLSPEHDDLARLARELGLPLRVLEEEARRAAEAAQRPG